MSDGRQAFQQGADVLVNNTAAARRWSTPTSTDAVMVSHAIIGYFLSRPRIAQHTGRPVTWFWMLALGYSLVALLLFLQALAGQPLIPL